MMRGSPISGRSLAGPSTLPRRACDTALDRFLAEPTTGNLERLRAAVKDAER